MVLSPSRVLPVMWPHVSTLWKSDMELHTYIASVSDLWFRNCRYTEVLR